MLSIELLGKNFPNPIGLAAGFDKSAEAYNSSIKIRIWLCGSWNSYTPKTIWKSQTKNI